MATRDEHLRGFPMDPGWDRDQPDPNWSAGQYHGMRMRPGGRQAAYGFHRLSRERDLLGYGGFHGVYDEGPGRFGADGAFRHPSLEARDPRARKALGAGEPSDARRVEDGGVRADNRYLAQYNAESPELAARPEGRGYGHAPAGGEDGALTDPGTRERPTDERHHAGYNRGGFADAGGTLDPRK